MLPDLKLVIRLQDLDSRVADLNTEIASLPGISQKLNKNW